MARDTNGSLSQRLLEAGWILLHLLHLSALDPMGTAMIPQVCIRIQAGRPYRVPLPPGLWTPNRDPITQSCALGARAAQLPATG